MGSFGFLLVSQFCLLILLSVLRYASKDYMRCTGDVVYIKDSCVWYIGREDNFVKVLGAAVYPNEVSNVVSFFGFF